MQPHLLSRREFMQRASGGAALALTPLGAPLVRQTPRPRWKINEDLRILRGWLQEAGALA